MKNIGLMLVGFWLAYLFLRSPLGHVVPTTTVPEPVAVTNPEPTATPFHATIPGTLSTNLVCLQGKIREIIPEGIVFECEEWQPPANPWMNFRADARDGAADIAQMAKLAIDYDQKAFLKTYGNVLEVFDGALRKASKQAKTAPPGRVLLTNCPANALRPEMRMRIIAAPANVSLGGCAVFSAQYRICTEFDLKPHIPVIQSLRGYAIRDVVVQRKDIDGFVLISKNGPAKVFNTELTPETIQMLTAAAPKN